MKFSGTLFFGCFCACLCNNASTAERIVSMSLCSDELVLLLADRADIASLSYLSANPEYSTFSESVTGITLNRGQAEEIIPLQPDLVLSSRFSATSATALLNQFGYPVHSLDFPQTLEGSYGQIREVAELLDQPERGAALIAAMQDRIANIQSRLSAYRNMTAVFYANNGFSFGSGTLRDSFLQSLGLTNLAAGNGLAGVGRLPLEVLVAATPDFLLVDQASSHDNKLAHPLLQHPALQNLFTEESVVVLPDRLFQCAGPALLDAYDLMLNALEARP